jgi:hypothetical protein
MFCVPFGVAPVAYRSTLSAPAVMVWLLVVVVVNAACAPAPISPKPVRLITPVIATVLSFIASCSFV